MSLKDDIQTEVNTIFKTKWEERDGKVIPDDESLKLGNDGIKIEATILYADLAGSTKIVQTSPNTTAAEIYKTFLLSACRVIRSNGGEITAFDGDRVMAVFMGSGPRTAAAKAALQINYAITKIVQPEYHKQYGANYTFEFGIGLDHSEILVAKVGIRGNGNNDLVWIGNSANIAAKLSSLRGTGKPIWMTEAVYDRLNDSSRLGGPEPKRDMWTRTYNNELNQYLYGSTWWWNIE